MHVEEGTVLVVISDTGTGIAANALPRIFEPGFSTKAPSEGGRGQGLFTCRAILRKHRGSIRSPTQTDVGTTFTVELPVLLL